MMIKPSTLEPSGRRRTAWRAIRLSWGLLSTSEKRAAALIAVATVLASLLDTISLIGIMPLVSLIVDPEIMTTSQAIRFLHRLVGAPDFEVFIKLVAFFSAGLIATSVSANFLIMLLSKRFRVACQNRLAAQLMERCLGAPYAWLLRQNSTTLAHHVFNDVLAWSSGGIHSTILLVSHISLLFLVALVIFIASALSGVIGILAVGVLATIVMLVLRPRIRRLSDFRRTASARGFSFASEFLGGAKDIKLSGREPVFVQIFGEAFVSYGEAMGNLKLLHAVSPLIMLLFGQVTVIVIALLLFGAGKSSGEIAAEMALVLLVTARAIPAMSRLTGEIGAIWNVIPNVEGINSLLAQLPPQSAVDQDNRKSSTLSMWQEIEFADVGYQYSADRAVAVSEISIVIKRGMSIGIVGPSGAGKTTFIDLLLGLLQPTRGAIIINGSKLVAENARAWQRTIGYVPQNPLISDNSLVANVAFGVPASEVDEARVLDSLKTADLSDVVESIGLQGSLGERGNRLSGGQRQRIAIARALYDKPDLLVLDEATSSLDTLSERAVQTALSNLHGKITSVTVAHRLSTVKQCDEIFVFDEGHLVAKGRYEQLLQTSPLFANLASSVEEQTKQEVKT